MYEFSSGFITLYYCCHTVQIPTERIDQSNNCIRYHILHRMMMMMMMITIHTSSGEAGKKRERAEKRIACETWGGGGGVGQSVLPIYRTGVGLGL